MPSTQGKVRNCLKCDREFFSAHFGQRLCRACRKAQVVLPTRGKCVRPEYAPEPQTCLDY